MLQYLIYLFSGTLRRQLISGVALVHAILMALFVWDLTIRQKELLLERQIDQAQALAKSVATSSAGWVAAQDYYGLQEIITAQSRYPELEFAMILDNNGRVLAHTDVLVLGQYVQDLPLQYKAQLLSTSAHLVDAINPIILADNPIGWVRVGLGQKTTSKRLKSITIDGIIYACIAIVIGSLLAFYMASRLTKKLRKIQACADAVTIGNTEIRAEVKGTDEISHVAKAFNSMLDSMINANNRVAIATDSAQLGIFDYNVLTQKLVWDKWMYTIYGISTDSFKGNFEDWARCVHAEDIEQANYLLDLAIKGKGKFNTEFRIIRPDGEVRWIKANATVINDKHGNASQLIGTNQDITEKVEQTKKLMEAKEEAERASIAKDFFLANMSHEIRTPMNAILGFTHLLLKKEQDASQLERLKNISSSGEHLLSLINDILDLSKIEAGKLELEKINFNLDVMLESIRTLLKEQFLEKGLLFDIEPHQVTPWLKGDPTRLRQAMLNYLSNAIKFTSAGKVVLRVKKLKQQDNKLLLRFEVQDSGDGIEPGKQKQLFKNFEQADSSTTREFGGTGLGLSITKSLANLMKGDAGVESVLNQGSTFWFTVWIEEGSADLAHPEEYNLDELEATLRHDYAGARILLVEDNEFNLEVAKDLLNDVDLLVETACNGREALEKVKMTNHFDLVLMDVQMPEMDGLEATLRIRVIPEHRNLPILAMTAGVLDTEKHACKTVGMNDFVSKPIKLENFYSKLIKWLPKQDRQRNKKEII